MAQTDKYAELTALCGGHIRTRFAPSPTGELHLGHAYSALSAWRACQQNKASFHLRIDDLDTGRCKPIYIEQIKTDLHWLGIEWYQQIVFQSKRLDRYFEALETLRQKDLVYPCYLSRKEADALLSAPHNDQDDLLPAPSTRHLLHSQESQNRRAQGLLPVWRLDHRKAIELEANNGPIFWCDHTNKHHPVQPERFGDVVIARRDSPASYHLSTVIDDADSAITLVVRGQDLAPMTQIHRLLQALLALPSPIYMHHPLVTDKQGKRLAKRHDALSLSKFRAQGYHPKQLYEQLPDFLI